MDNEVDLSRRVMASGRRRGVRWGSMSAAAVFVAGLLAPTGTAHAAVTTPPAGEVIRQAGPVTIHEDKGGIYTGTTTTNANLAALLCDGSSTNRSPRPSGRVQVIRASDNVAVVDVTHATPNGLSASAANAGGPFDAVWDTTGANPGTYRIRSTAVNTSRNGLFGACSGTNVTLSDHTVEYRPWQFTFNDMLGTGSIGMNTAPREMQWRVRSSSTPVFSPEPGMRLFLAPLTATIDFNECLPDIGSCLPDWAVECFSPCDARFAYVDHPDPNFATRTSMTGLFDLKTKAFIAAAQANGVSRVLLSLGPENDALVTGFLGDLIAGLSQGTGVDLPAILNTVVRIRTNSVEGVTTEDDISLAELLTNISPAPNGPTGVNILAPFSLGIGQILHTYAYSLPISQCATPHAGYTTTESQLVPSLPPLIVPAPPPLLIVEPGGTTKHVEGDYPAGTGSHAAGNTLIGPEVDTAPDAPSGLPVWLPLVDQGTVADTDIDFVGHAAVVSIEEVRIPALPIVLPNGLCIGFGALIGTGVALFGDNPLPVGFGALPLLWDEQDPAVQDLVATINGLSGDVLGNPTVQAALGTLLAVLAGGGSLDGLVASLGLEGLLSP